MYYVWYRFNTMSHSHTSNKTPLAKCSNLIKYVFYRLNLGLALKLERNLERAVKHTKDDIKGAYCYEL